MARTTPTVWVYRAGKDERVELELAGAPTVAIRLDSAAWAAWLAAPGNTSFAYPITDPEAGWICGMMTVRKEQRQRGSSYWVAYWRTNRLLRKIYLGRSEQVTGLRLAAVAAQFLMLAAGTASAATEGGEAHQA